MDAHPSLRAYLPHACAGAHASPRRLGDILSSTYRPGRSRRRRRAWSGQGPNGFWVPAFPSLQVRNTLHPSMCTREGARTISLEDTGFTAAHGSGASTATPGLAMPEYLLLPGGGGADVRHRSLAESHTELARPQALLRGEILPCRRSPAIGLAAAIRIVHWVGGTRRWRSKQGNLPAVRRICFGEG